MAFGIQVTVYGSGRLRMALATLQKTVCNGQRGQNLPACEGARAKMEHAPPGV